MNASRAVIRGVGAYASIGGNTGFNGLFFFAIQTLVSRSAISISVYLRANLAAILTC